jgi:hypothetical protein
MKNCTVSLIIACSMASLPGLPTYVRAQSQSADVVMSQHRAFGIPFQVASAAEAGATPREVLLYVSKDRGVNWQFVNRARPNAGQFSFQADADGEYWFLVRTVETSGQLSRAQISKPGLRVVIDTIKPTVQLRCQRDIDGRIHAAYQAHDAHLDPRQVYIEYQLSGSTDWQPVPGASSNDFQPQGGEASPGTSARAGQGAGPWNRATWNSTAEDTALTVRIRATDLAGNQVTAQTTVEGAKSNGHAVTESGAAPSRASKTLPTENNSPDQPASDNPSPELANQQKAKKPPNRRQDPVKSEPTEQQVTGPGSSAPAADVSDRTAAKTAGTPVPPTRQPAASVADKTPPERRPDVAAQLPERRSLPKRQQPVDPNGTNYPLSFPSTTFELPYLTRSSDSGDTERGNPNPGAILKAELWGTSDSGRSWTYYGADVDRQSPFHVTVPNEGLYGFRLLLHRGVATTSSEPMPGDLPNVWVMIDTE